MYRRLYRPSVNIQLLTEGNRSRNAPDMAEGKLVDVRIGTWDSTWMPLSIRYSVIFGAPLMRPPARSVCEEVSCTMCINPGPTSSPLAADAASFAYPNSLLSSVMYIVGWKEAFPWEVVRDFHWKVKPSK